jgi:hypothetical protein
METDAVKVTVVYESMFGNTRKVAEAISDGVREAYPDAHVECVAVGRASAELIRSTDLLIVGGPTHLRRMTTDSSRKRHISREKKAEAKGEPPRELEPDAGGPGSRRVRIATYGICQFALSWKIKEGRAGGLGLDDLAVVMVGWYDDDGSCLVRTRAYARRVRIGA